MEVNPTGRSALVVVSNGQYWSQSGKEETQGRPHHSPQVPDKRMERHPSLFSQDKRQDTRQQHLVAAGEL